MAYRRVEQIEIQPDGSKKYWCAYCLVYHPAAHFSTDKTRNKRDGLRTKCKWADKMVNTQKVKTKEKTQLQTIKQTVDEMVKGRKKDRYTGLQVALQMLDTSIPDVVAEMIRIATDGSTEVTRVRAGEVVAKLALGTKSRVEHSGEVQIHHGVTVLPAKNTEVEIIDVEVLEAETVDD